MTTENRFKVKFRGVRGSYPKANFNYLKFGGNTSCIEIECNKQLIILDAGTGIIDIETKNPQTTIILSHLHQDHIQGLQFYKPMYLPNSTINLFGLSPKDKSLKEALKDILFNNAFPLGLDEIKSKFNINDFSQDKKIVISQNGTTKIYDISNSNIKLKKDDVIISSYRTQNHPKDGSLSIKVEFDSKVLVYSSDKENKDEDIGFINFAKDCDCLIHDSQYTSKDYQTKLGFGHSTFKMAIETAQKAQAKKLFFFHYDPNYDDNELSRIEKKYQNETTFFAKENNEVDL